MQPRTFSLIAAVMICLLLMALSLLGTLAPAENLARVPLTFIEERLGTRSNDFSILAQELAEFRDLRQRNRQLEIAFTNSQSELAELRAYRSDYERLAEIANYVGQTGTTWRYVTVDVIGRDLNGVSRIIHINGGTRDGIAVGDPVVTPVGLVGRVLKVTATGAEVLLINDQNSAVSARVQNSNDERGLLRGSLSGELVLDLVDINGELAEDQQVFTSGETQELPPNLLLGQIRSVRLSPNELFQQATVVSLVDFDSLDMVLVITNWEPVDLSIFETPAEETP